MANNTQSIKLVIEGENKASGIFADIGSKLEGLEKKMQPAIKASQSLLKIYAGIGAGAVAFGVLAVKASADSELAWSKVRKQVELSGLAVDETTGELQKMATSYQRLTGFSDEYIGSVAGRLIPNLKDLNKVKEATMLALDLEKAGLASAESATKMLALAYAGEIDQVKRYIPELRTVNKETLDNMTASERAEYAIKLLKGQVGGLAETMGNTFAGQLNRAKEALGDVMELIGAKLLPKLTELMSKVAIFAENDLPIWIEKTKNIIKFLGDNKEALIIVAGAIVGSLIPAIYAIITAFVGASIALAPFILGGAIIAGLILGIMWIVKHWDLIKSKTQETWDGIKIILGETFDNIKNKISEIFTGIGDFFTNWFIKIKETFLFGINLAVGVVVGILDLMGIDVFAIMDGIKIFIETWFPVIYEIFVRETTFWKNLFVGLWTSISDYTRDTFNGLKLIFSEFWTALTSAFAEKTAPVSGAWSNFWNALGDIVKNVFNGVKSFVDDLLGGIMSKIESVKTLINNISNTGASFINKVKGVGEVAKQNITGVNSDSKEKILKTPAFFSSASPYTSINDGVLQNGRVISTSPEDFIIATKRPSILAGAGGGNITLNISGNSFVGREGIAEQITDDIMKILKRNIKL